MQVSAANCIMICYTCEHCRHIFTKERVAWLCVQDEDLPAVIVRVRGGVWSPLELDESDSGLPHHKVVWLGVPDDAGVLPIISAGADVPGTAFQPWSGRSGVWTANLKALGITKYGNLTTVRRHESHVSPQCVGHVCVLPRLIDTRRTDSIPSVVVR